MNFEPRITIAGRRARLLPERGLFLERAKTLVVADVHLGKAAAFRSASLALPSGSTSADLERLARALSRTKALRLVILGDFLHAREGRAPRTLEAARERERLPAFVIGERSALLPAFGSFTGSAIVPVRA